MSIRPINVRLVNACQHVDLSLDFGEGIMSIYGPNGSGKSNLVGLILATLVNDFSNTGARTKESNIYRHKSPGDVAYVSTTWQTPSGVVHVHRDLAGTKSFVSLNDEDQGCDGKEAKVTEKALDLLELSPAIVKNFMIADNPRLQLIVRGTKAERADMLTALCGNERIQQFERDLRDAVTEYKAVASVFNPVDLDKAWDTYQQHRAVYRQAAEDLASAGKPVSQEELDRLEDTHEGLQDIFDSQETARETIKSVKDLLRKQEPVAEAMQQRVTRRKGRLALLELVKEQREENWRLATQRKEQVDSVNEKFATLAGAKKRLQAIQDNPPKLPPGISPSQKELTAIEEQIAEIIERGNTLRKSVDLYDESQQGVCPTCEQPINLTEQQAEKLREELQQLRVSLKARQQEKKDTLTARDNHRDYKAEHASHEKVLAERQAAYTQAKAAAKGLTKADAGKLQTIVDICKKKARRAKQRLAGMQQGVVDESADSAERRTRLANHRERLQEAKESLAMYEPVARKEVTTAKAKLDAMLHRRELRRVAEQKHQTSLVMAINSAKDVRRLRKQRREVLAATRRAEFFTQCRDVLKRDRLPSRLIHNMFLRTAAGVNVYLASMTMPFRVVADPAEFAFTILHDDQSREPSLALSTGQGLCLGIAFWLARASVFESQFPFFVLDEPTANVDEKNVLAVAESIGALASQMAKEGRQGIVITHHAAVAAAATQRVSLGY